MSPCHRRQLWRTLGSTLMMRRYVVVVEDSCGHEAFSQETAAVIEWQINMVVALKDEVIYSTVVFDPSTGELLQQSNWIHSHKILHL